MITKILRPKVARTRRRQYSRNFTALEKRRRRGMTFLKKGQSQSEVARLLGVSEPTVFRWKVALVKKGATAWRRGRLGRPPKVRSSPARSARCRVRSK